MNMMVTHGGGLARKEIYACAEVNFCIVRLSVFGGGQAGMVNGGRSKLNIFKIDASSGILATASASALAMFLAIGSIHLWCLSCMT